MFLLRFYKSEFSYGLIKMLFYLALNDALLKVITSMYLSEFISEPSLEIYFITLKVYNYHFLLAGTSPLRRTDYVSFCQAIKNDRLAKRVTVIVTTRCYSSATSRLGFWYHRLTESRRKA